jgi:glycosyltransferase involved in cell wall biosynthesis
VPAILYMVHGFPPKENTGTPLVARSYAERMLERGWRVAVVYADPDTKRWPDLTRERVARVASSQDDSDGADSALLGLGVPFGHYAGWAIEAASAPEDTGRRSSFFAGLLESFRPDVVHVIDNVQMPLDWPERASASGVPVVRTVSCAEDLCGLIAPVSPLSDPVGYCAAPITPERCAGCVTAVLHSEWGWPRDDDRVGSNDDGVAGDPRSLRSSLLASRHRRLVENLQRKRVRTRHQFDDVYAMTVFSTAAFREYFEQTLSLDPAKVRVIEMGMDLADWTSRGRARPEATPGISPSERAPVVFCHAATLGATKGHDKLVQAFTDPELLDRSDYRLEMHGDCESSVVGPLLEVNHKVRATGSYLPSELPALLWRAQVGIATSRFETFHRVSREYMLAGLPVVANPTFGISGLVRDGVNGLTYDYADPRGLVRSVVALLDDPGLLARLARGARDTPIRSLDEEVEELVALYMQVIRRS